MSDGILNTRVIKVKMRVIEPSQLQRRSIKKKRSKTPIFVALFLILVIGGVLWTQIAPKKVENRITTDASDKKVTEKPAEVSPNALTFKKFTNEEFVSFYSSFAYPNTSEITTPPVITGNADADVRIRMLAEERGYKLRSAPVVSPIPIADGYAIQQKAQQPLADLIAAAKKQGMVITLTAAFRSVDEQKQLFLSRLAASAADIAAGKADASVNETLKVTAPPGYSRHHNGFTIDIACGDIGGLALLETKCFKWLSEDNFKNAKEFGWIPSYPEGATSIGPEPEPWEFVWVGRESLLE